MNPDRSGQIEDLYRAALARAVSERHPDRSDYIVRFGEAIGPRIHALVDRGRQVTESDYRLSRSL